MAAGLASGAPDARDERGAASGRAGLAPPRLLGVRGEWCGVRGWDGKSGARTAGTTQTTDLMRLLLWTSCAGDHVGSEKLLPQMHPWQRSLTR
jgi:hypothetical protein